MTENIPRLVNLISSLLKRGNNMPCISQRPSHALPNTILLALLILASSIPIVSNAADTYNDEYKCAQNDCTLSEVGKILIEAKNARDFVVKIGKRVKDDLKTAQQNEIQVIASDEQNGEMKKNTEVIKFFSESSVRQKRIATIKLNQGSELDKAIEHLLNRKEDKPTQCRRSDFVQTQAYREVIKKAGIAPLIIDSDLVIAEYQNAQLCASSVERIIGEPDGIDKEYDNAIELFNKEVNQQGRDHHAQLNNIFKIAKENICDIAKKEFDWKVQPSKWSKSSNYFILKDSVAKIQAVLDNPLNPITQREVSEVLSARKREVTLLNVVDKFPAASSLVGASGASFRGSTDGGNVTIKTPIPCLSSFARDINLSISTPAANTGNTRLISLDGMSDATTAQLNGRLTWPRGDANVSIVTLGAAGEIGRKSHDYYASNTATQSESIIDNPSKISAYLGASFGMWRGENNSFVLVKYQQAKSRVDQDATTKCQSLTTPCITGSFGLPAPQHSQLVSVEYRFADDDNGWAIAPVVTRALKDIGDKMSSINAVYIPFYFIPSDSDKSSLTGGFDIGWRSDSQWNLGLFIGANFNLFGN